MTTLSNQHEGSGAAEWFYQLLGLPTGPVPLEKLKWLIEKGHVTSATLIGSSQTGPWTRVDESSLAHLVGGTPKVDPNKKPVRISSGRKAVSKKLPALRDKPAAVVADPLEAAESTDFVTGGIELIEDLEVVEEPVVQKPVKANRRKPRSAQPATAVTAAPVLEDLEVVSPPTRRASSQANQTKKREQQLWYLKAAGVMLGVLMVVFLGRILFGAGQDTAGEAYLVFKEIGDGLNRNSSSMDDANWNAHLKDSRERVDAVLDPLRETASADNPENQSLVWAGEQLQKMLQGTRLIPKQMTAKFEGFMADYAQTPAPAAPPIQDTETPTNEIKDPAFTN